MEDLSFLKIGTANSDIKTDFECNEDELEEILQTD
jgi:hypothetical protein